jgi:hypothetical protein
MGLQIMSVVQCASLSPFAGARLFRTFYFLVAGVNLAGNVWEEIDLPGDGWQKSMPMFHTHGKEVRTDWADFASGAGASLLFVLYNEAIRELGFEAALAAVCRGQ